MKNGASGRRFYCNLAQYCQHPIAIRYPLSAIRYPLSAIRYQYSLGSSFGWLVVAQRQTAESQALCLSPTQSSTAVRECLIHPMKVLVVH